MDPGLVLVRFGSAFVLSLVLGLVRQKLGKPVGFGTFIFVAMGACALALTAVNVDAKNPFPLLASIVTGIGFLGAGTIIQVKDRVEGLTTAAGIWAVVGFGITLAAS